MPFPPLPSFPPQEAGFVGSGGTPAISSVGLGGWEGLGAANLSYVLSTLADDPLVISTISI